MKLYKKVVVIWGKNKNEVEGAAELAVDHLRAAELDVKAYGLERIQADPETDPQGDPSVKEFFERWKEPV